MRHKIIKTVIAVLLLGSLTVQYHDGNLRLNSAYAQVGGILTISWTPPTQYTDGFPLLEQELDFYTFYCNGAQVKQFDSIIGTRSNDVDISGLASGDYICQLTVTSLLGAESGPSGDLNFTIGVRIPGSPVGLTKS